MRQSPGYWSATAENLNDEELIALIKALTIIEQLPDFIAGSLSPVIWLFRKLADRSPGAIEPLADWILPRTRNNYLPFGSYNGGAQSLAELRQFNTEVVAAREERRRLEDERRDDARRQKVIIASHRLFGALRRRDEKTIAALLSRGADVQAQDESGQTALEYARSLGLVHLLTAPEDRRDHRT